jgi:hypothetical protein
LELRRHDFSLCENNMSLKVSAQKVNVTLAQYYT